VCFYNGLVANANGTLLYGAAVNGGVANEGAIFQFTP
jgi:uncharacterized repeat protein (TIGR03803 family)